MQRPHLSLLSLSPVGLHHPHHRQNAQFRAPPGPSTQNPNLNSQPPGDSEAHATSSVATRKSAEKGQMLLSQSRSIHLPSSRQGRCPHSLRPPPREPPSSSITHMEPGALTCEAAGLAGAHGAEQKQQGQPKGAEHGWAALAALGLSWAEAQRVWAARAGERALLFPVLPTVAMASEAALSGSSPLCLLGNACHCHGRVPGGACMSQPILTPGRWHL